MCRSCHKKYDLARLGKRLVTLKELPLSKKDKKILSLIAVKWVKNMRNGTGDTELSEDNFMRFFNITEEELKNE